MIQAILMPNTAVEYQVVLPSGTRNVRFKARGGARLLVTQSEGGTLADDYTTVDMTDELVLHGIATPDGLTLWLRSPSAAEVLEILTW